MHTTSHVRMLETDVKKWWQDAASWLKTRSTAAAAHPREMSSIWWREMYSRPPFLTVLAPVMRGTAALPDYLDRAFCSCSLCSLYARMPPRYLVIWSFYTFSLFLLYFATTWFVFLFCVLHVYIVYPTHVCIVCHLWIAVYTASIFFMPPPSFSVSSKLYIISSRLSSHLSKKKNPLQCVSSVHQLFRLLYSRFFCMRVFSVHISAFMDVVWYTSGTIRLEMALCRVWPTVGPWSSTATDLSRPWLSLAALQECR